MKQRGIPYEVRLFAGKTDPVRPSAYRAGRGPADTDRLLFGVGPRPGEGIRGFPGANDGAFAGAQTVSGKIHNAQLPGTEPQVFTSRTGE